MPTDFLIKLKKKDKTADEAVPEVEDDEVLVEDRQPSFFDRLFRRRVQNIEEEIEEAFDEDVEAEELAVEYEELEEIEDQIEEKKGRLFHRIFSLIKEKVLVSDSDGEYKMVGEGVINDYVVPNDLKKLLRIANNQIKILPSESMAKFKSSDDYEFYKETLKKYNLIR